MPAPTRAAQRAAQLDQVTQVLDAEIAATGERIQSAQRALDRHRGKYAELVEARATVRAL